MTVPQFAKLVGVSRSTAFKLVKDEEVESFTIGARRFIHYDAYVAYLARRVEESRSIKASA